LADGKFRWVTSSKLNSPEWLSLISIRYILKPIASWHIIFGQFFEQNLVNFFLDVWSYGCELFFGWLWAPFYLFFWL